MASGDGAEREAEVVDEAKDRGEAKRPVAEAEPEVQHDCNPTGDDGIKRPGSRLGGELAIEHFETLGHRAAIEFPLRLVEDVLQRLQLAGCGRILERSGNGLRGDRTG